MNTYYDTLFEEMFLDSTEGESIRFMNVEQLCTQVAAYEQQSNTKLYVTKSRICNKKGYREYKCSSHRNCMFHVRFVKLIDNTIVLKKKYLYHND